MNFTLILNSNNITKDFYLKQSKPMLETRLIEKLARNSKLIKAFDGNISHSLIRN